MARKGVEVKGRFAKQYSDHITQVSEQRQHNYTGKQNQTWNQTYVITINQTDQIETNFNLAGQSLRASVLFKHISEMRKEIA